MGTKIMVATVVLVGFFTVGSAPLSGLQIRDQQVTLGTGDEVILSSLFNVMGRLGGFTPLLDEGFEDRVVKVKGERMPVKQALAVLAEQFDLEYEVRDGNTLVVRSASTKAHKPLRQDAALAGLNGGDVPVLVRFDRRPLSDVLGALGKTAPFSVEFADRSGAVLVSVDWPSIPMHQALARLAETYGVEYEVPAPDELRVRYASDRAVD